MKPTTFALLALLVVAPMAAAEPPVKADFFVATDGSDENPGTAARPFATLARARDAVRKLKADGPPTAAVTVLIRGGTYPLKDPLVFGPEDSGTQEHPVLYAAYPGETPVLSGGEDASRRAP